MIQNSHSFSKKLYLSAAFAAIFMLASHQGFSQNNPSGAEIKNDSTKTAVVKDIMTVKNDNGTNGMVRIYTLDGQRISETLLVKGITKIDVSNLPNDEYVACVTMDGGARFNKRFIKE